MKEVVIVAAVRTPIGSFQGKLSSFPAPRLGAIAIDAVLKRAGVRNDQVDEVIMGNVLAAGEGQAPARQSALFAGLPESVTCMTINKVCGSGLKAVMLAAQAIQSGDADVIVAGGMESMSNTPYLLEKARQGYRMGHGQLVDSMIKDGLWDVYNDYHMGNAAELCARECHIPRDAQDAFARQSYERTQKAQKEGYFKDEIVPVVIQDKKGDLTVAEDEEPGKANFEKMVTLKPAFQKDGSVTAANASKINDGAAAVVVMSAERAKHLGLKPMVRLVAQASSARKPEWFTTAPIDAIGKVLSKTGMTLDAIDLFEINEAFAVVSLAAANELKIPHDRLNVHGGAIALGHPIGAGGTRILVTLLHAMKRYQKKHGMAAICIGGGEASAVIVESI